jgi:Tol biopolymer transport system component
MGVGIALGGTLTACPTADFNDSGSVTVDDVVAVIDDAPNVCPYVGQFAGLVPLSGGQSGKLDITVEPDGIASGTLTITDGSASSTSGSGAAVIDIVNVSGTADLRTGAFSLGGVFDGKPVSITGTFPSETNTSGSVTVRIDGVDYTGSVNAGNAVFTPVPTATLTPKATATRTPTPTATGTQGPPPTGQRLVLAIPDLDNPFQLAPEIMVVNLDGSGRRNLTQTPDLFDFNPVWSPDGNKIAWAAQTVIPNVGQYYHIVVMNADGTGRTDLMPDARGAADQPSWSPDGKKIVFSDQDSIKVVDVTGSHAVTQILHYTNRIGSPDWSPDGTKIAFMGTLHIPESQSDHDADQEIYVMNPDGSNPVRLTNNSYRDAFPAWSPDGKKIAFESDSPGSLTTVWVMNGDGTGQTKLITDFWGGTAPAWSEDGKQIAYYSGFNPVRLGIVVANADGSLPSVVVPSTLVSAPCVALGPTCTFFDLR